MKTYKKKFKIIKFKDGGYHIVIECKINGKKGLMTIDSGASLSLFDKNAELFNDFVFQNAESDNHSLTSSGFEVFLSQIDSFEIGRFKISALNAAFTSLDYINNVYLSQKKSIIIGLLGADFLIEKKVILDFDKKELIISRS